MVDNRWIVPPVVRAPPLWHHRAGVACRGAIYRTAASHCALRTARLHLLDGVFYSAFHVW
eukprot:6176422-Pleurochrysis_carterae.AAC.2